MFYRNNVLRFLAFVVVLVLGYLSVRVTTDVHQGTLDQVPRMKVFAPSLPLIPCTWAKQQAPHRTTVSVMTKIENEDQLPEIFPFLRDEAGIPGADTFYPRIPASLLKMPAAKTVFTSNDPFWLLSAKDPATLHTYGIRAAYSEQTGYFYLEYGWDT